DMRTAANEAMKGLIPKKSSDIYQTAYDNMLSWLRANGTDQIRENTLLPYFTHLLEQKKPTTVWSEYSCIKKMVRVYHRTDIGKFFSISDLLKQRSRTHAKKKANTFTSEQIDSFLDRAENTLD